MRGDRLGRGRRSVTCARGAVPEDHDSPSLYCPLTYDQRLHHLHGRDAGLVTEAVQQPEALLATIALHALLWAALITGIYRNLRNALCPYCTPDSGQWHERGAKGRPLYQIPSRGAIQAREITGRRSIQYDIKIFRCLWGPIK